MSKSRYESRAAIETKLVGVGLKWKAFLFSLMLFVFLEVAVIMYAGLNTHAHMVAEPNTNERRNIIGKVRWNLGLVSAQDWDISDNETSWNESRYADIAIHNETIGAEDFAAFYTEMCEMYFIPRTIKADTAFNNVYAKIVDNKNVLAVSATSSTSGSAGKHKRSLDSGYRSLNFSLPLSVDAPSQSQPVCPCVPKTLVGQIPVAMQVPYLGSLEIAHPDIHSGGHWHPPDCLARHRTAIIIPFRDREEHLTILLTHLHPLLKNQMLYYRIFVVEQVYPAVFNKASIMNVGYREAIQMDSFDCFIFHDVDMIPENDYNFYTCTPMPRHVGSHCDKFGYQVPYPNLFGGVTAFTREQFQKANGFSNEFYGWGGEDDDMFQRIVSSNMNISRFPSSIARYTMIKHGSDAGNPYNSHSYMAWTSRPVHYKQDGLNTVKYHRRAMEERPLYTWYLVELPDPKAIEVKKKSRSSPSPANHVVPCNSVLLVTFSIYTAIMVTSLRVRLNIFVGTSC